MSNSNDQRVLGRVGARALTVEEMEKITGSGINTRASHVLTGKPSAPDENYDS